MKQESNSSFQSLKIIKGRGGQAVVEMTLILIVSVSMLLAFRSVTSKLGTFMNKYVGDYVSCLMEYGELPALGVEEAGLKNHIGGGTGGKICDSKFEKFNFGNGFAAATGTKSGGTTNTKNNSDTATKRSSTPNENQSTQTASKSKSRRSSGDAAGVDSQRSGKERLGSSGPAYASADGANTSSSKVRVIDDDETDSSKKSGRRVDNSRASRVSYNRPAYRAVTGRMGDEIEKNIKESTRVPSSKTLAEEEDGYRRKNNKKVFMPPEAKALGEVENNEGFTFGSLLRWVLIIGMIIAIFVLFGGQILNYSNSKDQ